MDEEQVHGYPKSLRFDPKPGQEMQKGSPQPPSQKRGEEHQIADQEGEKERTDDEELEMGTVSIILCCTVLIVANQGGEWEKLSACVKGKPYNSKYSSAFIVLGQMKSLDSFPFLFPVVLHPHTFPR